MKTNLPDLPSHVISMSNGTELLIDRDGLAKFWDGRYQGRIAFTSYRDISGELIVVNFAQVVSITPVTITE